MIRYIESAVILIGFLILIYTVLTLYAYGREWFESYIRHYGLLFLNWWEEKERDLADFLGTNETPTVHPMMEEHP